MDNTVLSTVYNEFVSKAIHARFGTVFGNCKQKVCLKAQRGGVPNKDESKCGGSKKRGASSKKGKSNTKGSKKVTPEPTEPRTSKDLIICNGTKTLLEHQMNFAWAIFKQV